MATREEIIAGLELTVAQGKRTTSLFAEGEWDWKRAAGWTPKEVYVHLVSQAAIWPNFVQQLVDAAEGVDVGQGMDLDQWNAQSVATMASMTPEQVMTAFEENYGKLISFMKSVPDEQLNAKRRLFWEPIPVSDMLATYVMLHGLHHVYEASSRLGAPA